MPAPHSYDYAIVRVVPSVEREEFVNVGVVFYCRTRRYLRARIEVDRERLLALHPGLDLAEVERYLAAITQVCRGGADAGPLGKLKLSERFHWLVSPRSTIIQCSPVHSGLCAEPAPALARLVERMVRRPVPPPSPKGCPTPSAGTRIA
ncbi:MAG: DUF3037 domain-containing protein [Chloroflexota bacterium]